MEANSKVKFSDDASLGFGKVVKDGFVIKGHVKLELFDEHGNLKDVREVENTFTNPGLYALIDQWATTPTLDKPGWMEVGTGTGGTTKLATYIASSRTALTSKTRTNAALAMVCTFGAGVGTGAITEAGVFSIVTQDTAPMTNYVTFAVVNKAAGDSLTITWTSTAAAV